MMSLSLEDASEGYTGITPDQYLGGGNKEPLRQGRRYACGRNCYLPLLITEHSFRAKFMVILSNSNADSLVCISVSMPNM